MARLIIPFSPDPDRKSFYMKTVRTFYLYLIVNNYFSVLQCQPFSHIFVNARPPAPVKWKDLGLAFITMGPACFLYLHDCRVGTPISQLKVKMLVNSCDKTVIILAAPERVLVSQHRPDAEGFNFNSKRPQSKKLCFIIQNTLKPNHPRHERDNKSLSCREHRPIYM
jgi:hypothetical protein